MVKTENLPSLIAFDQSRYMLARGPLAGIDEAGRGPLAGPVVASAVVFYSQNPDLPGLNDSKQISATLRKILYTKIHQCAHVGIGCADEAEIDTLNIYQATRLAMKRAVLNLNIKPAFLIVDGKMKVDLAIAQEAVVKGDSKSAAVAAASIIAKVYRDMLMESIDSQYPEYLFKKHKGYPTREHLLRLRELGPAPVHRRTFEPVRQCLEKLPS